MQGQTRWLDLRFLIGWMFTIYGVVLAGYGLVANPQVEVMKGHNLNLRTGVPRFVFLEADKKRETGTPEIQRQRLMGELLQYPQPSRYREGFFLLSWKSFFKRQTNMVESIYSENL
ncbi:hypothetical protein GCM10011571_06450 [Marinithermofilum abyssi]|uniref:Uncharacterized protein n=1 Tax=Marinithermofilum abyssi TaxID=1571185 RepID=A0A8J2YA71_9BACL|nr:hypothetical protein GCM10011571_06450 [Marinithermofilum abyssi]